MQHTDHGVIAGLFDEKQESVLFESNKNIVANKLGLSFDFTKEYLFTTDKNNEDLIMINLENN